MIQPSESDIQDLDIFKRMTLYFSTTLALSQKIPIYFLDNANFSLSVFPEIFPISEVQRLHPIQPSYSSPDGVYELNQLIRRLEYARLVKNEPQKAELFQRLVDQAGLGCGNGCTNVLNGVLNAILELPNSDFPRQNDHPEVILALPTYGAHVSLLSNLRRKVTPKLLLAQRQHDFLPTFAEIEELTTAHTVAIILTYPSNPAQTTYQGESVAELKAIIDFCQENEIFLIADNIYQDLLYPTERRFEELFNWTETLDYMIKIYGSSKDTPFYAGYRTGYWFGDPKIYRSYRSYISFTVNGLATLNLLLFGLNLYFKQLTLLNQSPSLEDMDYFTTALFGFQNPIDPQKLLDNMLKEELHQQYKRRIRVSNLLQEMALRKVKAKVYESDCFSDHVNHDLGNVFFLRANPEYFSRRDHELFIWLLFDSQCGVMPGNTFGMPIKNGEAWFRITLAHDRADHLVEHLMKVEESLRKVRMGS